jgi:hypothetical protein
LRSYARTGRLSDKQAAAIQDAIGRIEADRASSPHLGTVGHEVQVEAEVVKVDYEGKGKKRRGRYVVYTENANIIYEGPAVLVGRLGRVRFTATVKAHSFSDAGQCDTEVENVRDVVVVSKPSDAYRSRDATPEG